MTGSTLAGSCWGRCCASHQHPPPTAGEALVALLAAPALVHPLRHLHALVTLCFALLCLALACPLWLAGLLGLAWQWRLLSQAWA